MTTDPDLHEYHQFYVELLNSKFKGSHTEAQMVERLIGLCQRKNKYALRALESAKLSYAPDSRMSNSIWASGAIYGMVNVAAPSQTGPSGTDNFGLWRYDGGKR